MKFNLFVLAALAYGSSLALAVPINAQDLVTREITSDVEDISAREVFDVEDLAARELEDLEARQRMYTEPKHQPKHQHKRELVDEDLEARELIEEDLEARELEEDLEARQSRSKKSHRRRRHRKHGGSKGHGRRRSIRKMSRVAASA